MSNTLKTPRHHVGVTCPLTNPSFPLKFNYLIRRLNPKLARDFLKLIAELPPSFLRGLDEILGLAPPLIIGEIVTFFEDYGGEDIALLQARYPEGKFLHWHVLRLLDSRRKVLRFLLELTDDQLHQVHAGPNAAFHLVQQLARTEILR